MRSIDLIESPQQIFRGPVDIIASRVIREVIAQGRPSEFLFEEIDFVQEEDDAGSHEPPGVDDGIEKHQALHHPILFHVRPIYSRHAKRVLT